MKCNNCGNENAYRMKFFDGGEYCNICGGLSAPTIHDVFFQKPYLDPHLVDVKRPEQKDGVWIESRAQKAAIMRQLGVVEKGDRFHGARNAI